MKKGTVSVHFHQALPSPVHSVAVPVGDAAVLSAVRARINVHVVASLGTVGEVVLTYTQFPTPTVLL